MRFRRQVQLEVRDGSNTAGGAETSERLEGGKKFSEKASPLTALINPPESPGGGRCYSPQVTICSSSRKSSEVDVGGTAAWQSLVCRCVSAQHGGRLDTNLSGLCNQQSGGGSRGVAGRAGVLEQGRAGFTAVKILIYIYNRDVQTRICRKTQRKFKKIMKSKSDNAWSPPPAWLLVMFSLLLMIILLIKE